MATETVRVVVVARTRMGGGRVCIGALSEAGENLRLLNATCGYETSLLQVGQRWEVTFSRCPITAPHSEDVAVIDKALVDAVPDTKAFILKTVNPTKGGIGELFDKKIAFTNSGSGYISPSAIPAAATGFWILTSALHVEHTPRGVLYGPKNDYRHLKFVGFQEPVLVIPAGTLVRVSLAKWWKPKEANPDFEERCYAQLSGWFT